MLPPFAYPYRLRQDANVGVWSSWSTHAHGPLSIEETKV